MKKSVTVEGQKIQVEYSTVSRKRIVDNSAPSKKYKGGIAYDYLSALVISIDGKRYRVLQDFKQDGGDCTERWTSNNIDWVGSEEELIEQILNK